VSKKQVITMPGTREPRFMEARLTGEMVGQPDKGEQVLLRLLVREDAPEGLLEMLVMAVNVFLEEVLGKSVETPVGDAQ
jgi:hypothetical protein